MGQRRREQSAIEENLDNAFCGDSFTALHLSKAGATPRALKLGNVREIFGDS